MITNPRTIWAIKVKTGKDTIFPVYGSWHKDMISRGYNGEPTRIVAFINRKLAREWCKEQNESHAHLGWKYSAVKVEEVYRPTPGAG